MTLDALNALDSSGAQAALLRCCGSVRFARAMAAERPFQSLDAMIAAADRVSAALTPDDWLEAFAAHPRIGSEHAVSAWSSQEQSGMRSAGEHVRARLAALNADYESRFGFIFIVCATGKTPAQMLALIEARLPNSPDVELQTAASEQRKITALRLVKLVDGPA